MMQKKIASILFSTRLTATLFLVFAAAMAVGTFLDQGYSRPPSPYARELIFNAWWFEAIMIFFVINFSGNIVRFRLYKKEKWAKYGFPHIAIRYFFGYSLCNRKFFAVE